MYGLAQYGLTNITNEKLALYHKMNECNRKYAKLATPAWQEVKVPYRDYVMDGWLALPRVLKPENPIVISIAGATAFKDKAIHGVEGHLASGRAVLLIDGLGQGTTRFFNDGFLEVELEKAYSKMIDFVKADGRFGKIAITGGSTGGYYVARVPLPTNVSTPALLWVDLMHLRKLSTMHKSTDASLQYQAESPMRKWTSSFPR